MPRSLNGSPYRPFASELPALVPSLRRFVYLPGLGPWTAAAALVMMGCQAVSCFAPVEDAPPNGEPQKPGPGEPEPDDPNPDEPSPGDEDLSFGIDTWCAEGAGTRPSLLPTIEDAYDFALLQVMDSPGVKFLARVDGEEPPGGIEEECIFQDMNRWEYHLLFLRENYPQMSELSMGTYADWVLRSETRRWWGGEVHLWPGAQHPLTGVSGVVALAVMSDSSEGLDERQLEEVYSRIAGCMHFARDLLVFVPSNPMQQASMLEARQALAEKGIGVLPTSSYTMGLAGRSYSDGVSFGILRIVEADADVDSFKSPGILVAAASPASGYGLGGLLTAVVQEDDASHNETLRSRELPSAMVSGIVDNALIRAFEDLPARLEVKGSIISLLPASCEDSFLTER